MIVHDLLSMEIMISRNMTFDNTTYDQLAEMTADVLAQVVAAEEEVRIVVVVVAIVDCCDCLKKNIKKVGKQLKRR